jgi:hypothetical protein
VGVLGTYGQSALKYWGAILSSAQQGLKVSDMWNAIRDAQQQYGLDRPGVTGPDVMVLRGYANRLVNGAAAFEAAAPGDTITADMMGVGPYTQNDLNGIALNPTYQVRFVNQVQLPDGTVSEAWQTTVFTAADWPQTKNALQDTISLSASELAAQGSESSTTTPRGTSLGFSQLQITVVLDARPGALPAQ